jgi:hypothetical protein
MPSSPPPPRRHASCRLASVNISNPSIRHPLYHSAVKKKKVKVPTRALTQPRPESKFMAEILIVKKDGI